MARVTVRKFVDKIKFEPEFEKFAEIKIPFLGKPTNFEVLSCLRLPKTEVQANPYNLGRAVGVDIGFRIGEAIDFLNEYSKKEWNGKILLEPYSVAMHIAQNCTDAFNRVRGTALTNTVAIRSNGKFGLDMPVIEDGKVKTFLDGKPEVYVEDYVVNIHSENRVSYLDKNMWPSSCYQEISVKRPTHFWDNIHAEKASVMVDRANCGDVYLSADISTSFLCSNSRFPLVGIK